MTKQVSIKFSELLHSLYIVLQVVQKVSKVALLKAFAIQCPQARARLCRDETVRGVIV
jgi:hypothetical protein